MAKDTDTILIIGLGVAAIYFFTKKSSPAAALPVASYAPSTNTATLLASAASQGSLLVPLLTKLLGPSTTASTPNPANIITTPAPSTIQDNTPVLSSSLPSSAGLVQPVTLQQVSLSQSNSPATDLASNTSDDDFEDWLDA